MLKLFITVQLCYILFITLFVLRSGNFLYTMIMSALLGIALFLYNEICR